MFSTYVEVILDTDRTLSQQGSVLHVCGGDPKFNSSLENQVGANEVNARRNEINSFRNNIKNWIENY